MTGRTALPFNKIGAWTPRYTRERLQRLIEYYLNEAETAREQRQRIIASVGRRGKTFHRLVDQEDRARATKECLWAIYSRLPDVDVS